MKIKSKNSLLLTGSTNGSLMLCHSWVRIVASQLSGTLVLLNYYALLLSFIDGFGTSLRTSCLLFGGSLKTGSKVVLKVPCRFRGFSGELVVPKDMKVVGFQPLSYYTTFAFLLCEIWTTCVILCRFFTRITQLCLMFTNTWMSMVVFNAM